MNVICFSHCETKVKVEMNGVIRWLPVEYRPNGTGFVIVNGREVTVYS